MFYQGDGGCSSNTGSIASRESEDNDGTRSAKDTSHDVIHLGRSAVSPVFYIVYIANHDVMHLGWSAVSPVFYTVT